jgi:hypothetical protein
VIRAGARCQVPEEQCRVTSDEKNSRRQVSGAKEEQGYGPGAKHEGKGHHQREITVLWPSAYYRLLSVFCPSPVPSPQSLASKL